MNRSSLLLLSLASLPWLAACNRHEPAVSTAPALPTVPVQVVTAKLVNEPAYTEITGRVNRVQRATLAAKLMGTIDGLPVVLGQNVAEGDLLVHISAAEISARLAQAKAQLNQVSRDLERERTLLDSEASTADMVKSLEDRYTMTAAGVREAETMLGYASIRAPFAGTITRKNANVGDLAAPGQPLLEIEGEGAFEIEAGIPDSLATHLSLGTEFLVEVTAAKLSFTGTLVELSTSADGYAHSVPARIAVPAGTALRAGQFARVHLPGPAIASLRVPVGTVSMYGQMERIFVVDVDRHARLRIVKTGAIHQDQIEVLAGLNDGDRVVVSPPVNLRDGQTVEILP
ncbi:MAG: efflux RND transporter periplasmic adaptor subunit [Cephaloticoccus sp.]|nr:efflux RND transporter periplasmic adaptor subunit [Cephaloticoccus sp.]